MKNQAQSHPPQTREHARLKERGEGVPLWRRWGPYVSERAWGTVREDYSAGGDAWRHLPHDLAVDWDLGSGLNGQVHRWIYSTFAFGVKSDL